MAKQPKLFGFDLTVSEANWITTTPITGSGGRQSLQRKLKKQLLANPNHVDLDDVEFGRLCRYIGQYQGGGAQDRFRNSFKRSLKKLLSI